MFHTKGFMMDNNLRDRASKNFEKYFNAFIQYGESNGLPHDRLTENEWKALNKSLVGTGVQLVPRVSERNGYLYYWFSKEQPVNKLDALTKGKERVENNLVELIQKKYPNFPKVAIQKLLQTDSWDTDTIYKMLRYKQDGEYTGVTQKQYESAFTYAMMSAFNRSDLMIYAGQHNWNPFELREGLQEMFRDYFDAGKYYGFLNSIGQKWSRAGGKDERTGQYKARNIVMDGGQHWTWFRRCAGATLPHVVDSKNPDGFHISLNVNANEKLLRILDNILIEDGGRYINAYKIPKISYYNEVVTRHDPVTIYMYSRNPELEKKIVNAVQPFVRSNDGLIGEMLGNGVSISPETSHQYGCSVGTRASQDIANLILQNRTK